jgi:hypothetical protein
MPSDTEMMRIVKSAMLIRARKVAVVECWSDGEGSWKKCGRALR